MVKCVALVVAAGRGRRFSSDTVKQYHELGGRMVLRHCLAAFAAHPDVDYVRTVIHPDDRELYEIAAENLNLPEPVTGGATRQESVRLGLESLKDLNPEKVLIHDGARPFVTPGLINEILYALEMYPAAIPALPVSDTLKKAEHGIISQTVDRAGLWRAQTPQGFDFKSIYKAHLQAANTTATDDAAIAEMAGDEVFLTNGRENNFKITLPEDLARAERHLVHSRENRTGFGFDVHTISNGNGIMLNGIHIKCDMKLVGHSDADVALHSITDALLGAICAGDIGAHFPPSDEKWKGTDSATFLRHTVNLVQALGGRIIHIDNTIICERPRIGAYRTAMLCRLAEITGLDQSRINVKATTTEKLGFTGRGEGIAAQTVATVEI